MKILEAQTGVIIILGTLVGGYIFFLNREVKPEGQRKRNERAPQTAPKESIVEAPMPKVDEKAREEARRDYNIRLATGVTPVPTQVNGDKLRVTILPKIEAQWCKTGDFDLIKAIASNAKDKLITLSIESMKKNGAHSSEALSLGELSQNKAISFDLPLANGAYGLYLCTDQGKKGSCGSKPPVNPRIWSAGPAQIKKLAQDRVFYFQLLHVKNASVSIIPSDSWGEANIKELKARLKPWMGIDVDALDKMGKMIARLQPMPARLNAAMIEIPLPYNDMRCSTH